MSTYESVMCLVKDILKYAGLVPKSIQGDDDGGVEAEIDNKLYNQLISTGDCVDEYDVDNQDVSTIRLRDACCRYAESKIEIFLCEACGETNEDVYKNVNITHIEFELLSKYTDGELSSTVQLTIKIDETEL